MTILGGMSRETQKRGILHTIRDLADAGLMVDGDGQVQVVCILFELVKYIELCPNVPQPIGRTLSAFARQWYDSVKDVHVDAGDYG